MSLKKQVKQEYFFCKDVMDKAIQTVELSERIAKVGNKMLSSDFEISKKYAISSVEASIVNIEINLKFVNLENFKTILTLNIFYDNVCNIKSKEREREKHGKNKRKQRDYTNSISSNNNYNANLSRGYYFVTNIRKRNNNKSEASKTNV